MRLGPGSTLLSAILLAFATCLTAPADAQSAQPAILIEPLTASQIVAQMREHAQTQRSSLKQYKSVRHYQVEYSGFSTKVDANMDVEASYDAANGKSFKIISENGSKALREKVLRRALESEREAAQDTASTALSEQNYRFQLLGSDTVGDRPAFILDVQPLTASKFLYRGKIWVDAADFAVVKMETEPAKSPSFWIARTLIYFTSAKEGNFWLPRQMTSETRVRIGGTAVMTIDYGNYELAPESAAVEPASR